MEILKNTGVQVVQGDGGFFASLRDSPRAVDGHGETPEAAVARLAHALGDALRETDKKILAAQ